MIIAILLIIMFIVIIVSLLICLFFIMQLVIRSIKKVPLNREKARLKKSAFFFTILVVLMVGFITFSQFTAHTPRILNQNGKATKGSIAELKKVELNGRREWISIRGKNRKNPVLLFLTGGPGGTQLTATRYELSGLEEHFVVVNWDQPGSGKSYDAVSRKKITVDTYIEDGLALTDFLRKSFKTEKIYLMGESWGSALGIFLADAAPAKYHAFIGTGQMVDFKETEIMDYKKAIKLARENRDEKIVKKLIGNGMPPYYGKDVTWKSAVYLNYLSDYMAKNHEITNGGYHTIRDMFSDEYGIVDSINYLRGIINTFNQVYPQLYNTDLRKGFTKLDIPVYFFLGRHDVNAPLSLTQEYYNSLKVPKKEIVWFEHSGHSPWMNESKLFVSQTVRVFLKK
ncbi:alpha/beta fold hydrolase [Clostridium oryzae]|uniref:prolyl aminopeptidase n=1 Tax=Clostridium oryzae TaxID=1450648 RepID=A0A1V4IHJ2_9CLOT|nr:alpha/beta hydrolase [Clostridium oryzae]OPJ59389.1 alpha/beta hydrolase family protein [Clostridium oryzae]